MSWTLTVKTAQLTKALINRMQEMAPYTHDRPLRRHHVEALKTEITENRFTTCPWGIAYLNGDEFRVNGQHTAKAFSEQVAVPDIRITIHEYDVDSVDDIAEIYASYDPPIASRSADQIYLQVQSAEPSFANIPGNVFSRTVSGMAYANFGVSAKSYVVPPALIRAKAVVAEKEFALFVHDVYLSGADRPQAQRNSRWVRRPILGAAYKTWKKNHLDAYQFWSHVVTGNDPDAKSPSRTLGDYLLGVAMFHGAGSYSEKKRATVFEIYCKCLVAWNAWRNGESTRLRFRGKEPVVK